MSDAAEHISYPAEQEVLLYSPKWNSDDFRFARDEGKVTCAPLDERAVDLFRAGEARLVAILDTEGDPAAHVRATQELLRLASLTPATAILVGDGPALSFELPDEMVFACLPDFSRDHLKQTVRSAFAHLELVHKTRRLEDKIDQDAQTVIELNRIGVALSAEHDLDAMLELILSKSRAITSADAGSLYLIEGKEGDSRRLRFKLSQNDSFPLSYKEFTMELSKKSLAGYVALTGETMRIDDVYELPPDAEHSFNRSFDESTGYRTKSTLLAPMRNHQGEILGVVQLINRKRRVETILKDQATVAEQVIPFTRYSVDLVNSLASQAAVALENNLLYQSIEHLFEGFVRASVTAIESRDPTTHGHSERVAMLTVSMAEAVSQVERGRLRIYTFNPKQLKEIRYAALLHDVGKIGVRENVLVKAKKLYEYHLQIIQDRFDFVKKALESEYSQKKIERLLAVGREDYLAALGALEQDYLEELGALDRYFQIVMMANEPTVLPTGSFERLEEIAARTYRDLYGTTQKLLQPEEVEVLSIRKGSLSEDERLDIESHVTHSFRFLIKIPWTTDLKNVPSFAGTHHEKLDGSGYPNRMTGEDIPIQARMMTIADIYDALTAADRPYKKAQPLNRAIDILQDEVKHGKLDKDLTELFIAENIFDKTKDWKRHSEDDDGGCC